MSLLSTILITVCDVVIVLCFVLFYRRLEKRVFSLKVSLNDTVRVLAGDVKEIYDVKCSLRQHRSEIDFLCSDVRKLDDRSSSLLDRFGYLENSHCALSTHVQDLNRFCDSLITFKEVKPATTKKTTKKSAKNGKVK